MPLVFTGNWHRIRALRCEGIGAVWEVRHKTAAGTAPFVAFWEGKRSGSVHPRAHPRSQCRHASVIIISRSRQVHGHRRPLADGRVDLKVAAVRLDDMLADEHSEACPI